MVEHIKYIELKTVDLVLNKRNQLTKLGDYGDLGPADSCFMYYTKQATFLSKKQERIIFYFFQGLNVAPENLSIKIREIAEKVDTKSNKQKLVKAMFVIYDIFNRIDIAIQLNIPGALKMFKISPMKELIGSQQLQRIYLSSMIRSMFELNMAWGKYFKIFDSDNPIQQFKQFMTILIKSSQRKRIYISDSYEATSQIQGNHMLQIAFQFIKQQHIIHHALDFFTDYIKSNTQKFWQNKFAVIMYTQLLFLECKFYKSLKAITILSEKNKFDPYLLYYQAKYLQQLNMTKQSLKLLCSIKQYNQPKIWLLLAQIYLQQGSYSDVVLCLNILCKSFKQLSKYKPSYKQFQSLGKIRKCERNDELNVFPSYLIMRDDSLICIEKSTPTTQYKDLVDLPHWKLNPIEFQVYQILQQLRKNLDKSKFQKLIQDNFIASSKQYSVINFNKGFTKQVKDQIVSLQTQLQTEECEHPDLPRFLKSPLEIQKQQFIDSKVQRSLSIIPEIQSFVESTVIKDKIVIIKQQKKSKHLLSEKFLRIITLAWKDNKIQTARRQQNWKALLTIFNALRKTLYSNFIYNTMFHIFASNQNQKSVLILLTQLLTDLQHLGVRSIEVLPYWVQSYIKNIIVDKGLQFLNQTIKGLQCYEEGLIDTIKQATKWKIVGIQH